MWGWSLTGFGWYMKNNPDADLEAHSTKFIHEMNGYPMAIGCRNSNWETVEIVNKAIQQLREQGAMDELFTKYGLSEALR